MKSIRAYYATVGLALLACAGPGIAEQSAGASYRVTAIYGRAADGYTALVQPTEGKMARVRAGDRLGDLRVDEVAERWITVRRSGADTGVRIWLDGADPGIASRGPDSGSAPRGAGAAAGSDRRGQMPTAQPGGHAAASPGAVGNAGAGSPPASGPELQGPSDRGTPIPGERSLPEVAESLRGTLDPQESFKRPVEDLGAVLGPMLGLPADTKIVELASAPPVSFRDGIRYVLRASQANEIVRLTVETPQGRQRVMVFPGAEGEPARVGTFDVGPANSGTLRAAAPN